MWLAEICVCIPIKESAERRKKIIINSRNFQRFRWLSKKTGHEKKAQICEKKKLTYICWQVRFVSDVIGQNGADEASLLCVMGRIALGSIASKGRQMVTGQHLR